MIPEPNVTRRDKVFSDHQIPIGRVLLYDTRFTVPSNGIIHRIYDLGDTPGNSPVLYNPYYPDSESIRPIVDGDANGGARVPIIMSDWETGVESAVTGAYFATIYEGYFYARATGTYTFRTDYLGGAAVYFDTDTANGFITGGGRTKSNLESAPNEMFNSWAKVLETTDPRGSSESFSVSLTSGQFYQFRVKYWNQKRIDNAIVISFLAPDATSYIPLSAGSCSDYFYKSSENDYFLDPLNALSVVEMSGSRKETDSASYNFTVRVSGTDSQNAYSQDNDSFGTLKKDMLVKFQIGYSTNDYAEIAATADFVTRFVGFITSDVTIYRDKYGANAVFTCNDFKTRLIMAPNINYPNTVAYLFNQFSTAGEDRKPDGFNRVRFFDRWPLEATVRTLLMLGGIDPTLLYKKHRMIDVDNNVSDTILDTIHLQDIILESRDSYASPNSGIVWPDEYEPLWLFRFGTDSVNDILNELSKNYGFRFLFSSSGIPYVVSVDYYHYNGTPEDEDTDDYVFDQQASGYQYYKITGGNSKTYEFYGSKADLILKRGPSCGGFRMYISSFVGGSWSTESLVKSAYQDGELQEKENGLFSAYFPIPWGVRQGMYHKNASNPSIIKLPGLPAYGRYRIRVAAVGEDLFVDGVRSYVIDSYTPVRNYTTANVVKELTIVDNVKDMINEVIVVGSELGPSIGPSSESASHIPKQYVYHKAVDVRSQIDPSYKYYRGRKIPVIIKEPKITQQDRARWLAEYTLERYRTNALTASYSSVGDPFIEVYDPITIHDLKTGFITPEKIVWIIGFSESLRKGEYSMSGAETTPRTPVPSFIKQDTVADVIAENHPEKFVAFEDIVFTGSYTVEGTGDEGKFGETSYGSSVYGGKSLSHYGDDFSVRLHFDPYAARENGDVLKLSWTLLKRGYQYLEIWDTQSPQNVNPYAAYSPTLTNAGCTAASMGVANEGNLISVVYLNKEALPDEPGNYSVTWDSVYEQIDLDAQKWATQRRYCLNYQLLNETYNEEVHGFGDTIGPSGANVFGMPTFDSTGVAMAVENWPHRTRANLVNYPLRIKHVFIPVESSTPSNYWWGTSRLSTTMDDFTAAYPFYIHTLRIPDRFKVDFDFVRVKKVGDRYETLPDLFVDNYYSREFIPSDHQADADEHSSNYTAGGGPYLYVNEPGYYRNSKLVNATTEDDHKFGVYLTCDRPNQRLAVIHAFLGYMSNLTGMFTSKRLRYDNLFRITYPGDDPVYVPVSTTFSVSDTPAENTWIHSFEYTGSLSDAAELLLGKSDGVIDTTVTNRIHNLLSGSSPFNYSWKSYDSTVNLTGPLNDKRNCIIINLKRGDQDSVTLFNSLRGHGNPPLDDRYLFHPAWIGGFDYNNTDEASLSGKFLMPGLFYTSGAYPNFGIGASSKLLEYRQSRPNAVPYPKSLLESFHGLCTLDCDLASSFTSEQFHESGHSVLGDPRSYEVVGAKVFQYVEDSDPNDYAHYTSDNWLLYGDTDNNAVYHQIKLVLYTQVIDEGGRVYRIVPQIELDSEDENTLDRPYSNVQGHVVDEADLLTNNPSSDYYKYHYYNKFPTAILGMANDDSDHMKHFGELRNITHNDRHLMSVRSPYSLGRLAFTNKTDQEPIGTGTSTVMWDYLHTGAIEIYYGLPNASPGARSYVRNIDEFNYNEREISEIRNIRSSNELSKYSKIMGHNRYFTHHNTALSGGVDFADCDIRWSDYH